MEERARCYDVMAGPVPAIYDFVEPAKSWMLAPSASMTVGAYLAPEVI